MPAYRLSTCPAMADLHSLTDEWNAAITAGDPRSLARIADETERLDDEIRQRRAIHAHARKGNNG